MKIEPRLVTVVIPSEDGDAVLKFERMRKNERLKMQIDLSSKDNLTMNKIGEYWETVMSKCVSVENLFEGDRAVTVEDIKCMRLYEDVIQLIHDKYWEIVNAEEAAKLPKADPKLSAEEPVSAQD